MTYIFSLIVLLLDFPLINCNEEPKPHYTVSQETKDYCVFQNDTRWIYEEENSSSNDSLKVYDNTYMKIEDDQEFYFDDIRFKCMSSKFGYSKNIFIDFIITPRTDQNPNKSWCWGGTPKTRGISPVEYFEESTIGEIIIQYANTDGIKYTTYYDSLEILGHYYYQVKVFEYLTKFGEAYPKKIYWAKHIGRIRYELWNGEVWNLKEYSIIQ